MSAGTVELREVSKAFAGSPVVRALSLQVRAGELLSLLGPSGCGKTTTLRMVAGLEHPDAGVVRIGGTDVFDAARGIRLAPERRELGMVFQSYAVWPHRTVAENVAYPLQLRKVAKSELAARAAEALQWVRLGGLADRAPSSLSGGQLQRVALARALVASPKVLLLDEPLSNLDAALREELRGELAALRARLGTTVLFVTHDQGEALALSDRVAVMNCGRIEQLAAPQALYAEPATPFVASFVGGANLLEGSVSGGVLEISGVRLPLPAEVAAPEGPASLAVRPEDVAVAADGVPLPLEARLFLGQQTEYRLKLGERLLRMIGPAHDCRAGDAVPVKLVRARRFR